MSKGQQGFYNDGMCGRTPNCLFRYRTETANQTLLIMFQTCEGTSDLEVEKLYHKQAFYNLLVVFLNSLTHIYFTTW